MIISESNKSDNLKILNHGTNIKDLEISNLSVEDDWSLIAKAKNLENLTIKDSYIDYKKFYNAICSLKKLNKITYNTYCYFNKNKKDKFLNTLNLPSLKTFRLEFPDASEVDFEINNWSQKSYENNLELVNEDLESLSEGFVPGRWLRTTNIDLILLFEMLKKQCNTGLRKNARLFGKLLIEFGIYPEDELKNQQNK